MTISNLDELLKNMKPNLKNEKYFIGSFDDQYLMNLSGYLDYIVCVYKEKEGLTVIFSDDILDDMKDLTERIQGPFALITLEVNSDLMAVGFMAKIADALAKEKISCNAVSAYHHDHIFVQYERKEAALTALKKLSEK
ncbi:MAG: ACT domain-containing protein [Candidatus Micrarchaeota archaeon]